MKTSFRRMPPSIPAIRVERLVNTKGELVGINTAIFSQSGGYQGVGFAVPTSMGKPIYESLVKPAGSSADSSASAFKT